MSLLRPRTIRGQLIAGLILFEVLLVAMLATVMVAVQSRELDRRSERRVDYQVSLLAVQAEDALLDRDPAMLERVVEKMRHSPSIRAIQVTDTRGVTIVSADPSMKGKVNLSPVEQKYLRDLAAPAIFRESQLGPEGVAPIRIKGRFTGLAWVYADESEDRAQLRSLVRITLFSALLGVVGCAVLASWLGSSITRPLDILMRATRQLIRDPEDMSSFPLAVSSSNEAADLTSAFNLMVASIEGQRAGLNDTLALLDSMLANAPIGFAFFDRKFRFVRINQFLADLNQLSIGRHLGRTVSDVFPGAAAVSMQDHIRAVFDTGQSVQDLELSGELAAEPGLQRSWLVNLYPVKTANQAVRWAGAIIVDTTERKQSEEALRRTEKLAAAGRLATSIAHEINNPLEAITNLLYLTRALPALDPEVIHYTELAQHEVSRVSEITQQTLRFYRQSTLPVMSNISELLDSVLTLHKGRVHSLQVTVERDYQPDVELFGFAGELRQVFANLIGNALDAMMPRGGRLVLAVRSSRSWHDVSVEGVRLFVADTGSGMDEKVRKRIFEPFFTTKEVIGTGLGLWVSAEIIQKHKGIIRVRSQPRDLSGRASGTVFMVFFPARQPDQEAPREQ
jgi:signal transduction histidine kinase